MSFFAAVVMGLVQGIADMLPTLIPTIVSAVVLMVETLLDNIDLIIDVNGKDSPNIFGRDIFGFLLNNDGRLIPYGDTESLHITDKVKTSSLGDTSRVTDNWKTSCSNAVANNGGPTCTAKVVNEGYKINY